jgi:hypothetical protein
MYPMRRCLKDLIMIPSADESVRVNRSIILKFGSQTASTNSKYLHVGHDEDSLKLHAVLHRN